MMNGRNGRDSLYGSINHNRRSHTFNHHSNNHHDDNTLDLFSNNRRSLSLPSSDDSSDVSVKLGRLSVGGAKQARNGIEDMLSSVEGGKHDYDWLLTPPGTPVFPSSENEPQSTLAPPRRSLSRSTSTAKASRLSVSQSESNNHSNRPARSSSVTRSSISTSHSQYNNNNYSSNRSSSTNILNTSSASVSSYIRPSSPVTRSTSSTRPSTPTSRTTASRSSTPSRIRSVSTSSAAEKPRTTSQSSRPSTPSSRPQVPANLHSPSAPSTRSLSRPSTPTRRSSIPSLSPSSTTSSSISAGRVSLNGRSSAPSSRPSSPSPRVRPPPQPVVPPDFPLDTPPNLRTTLPDRPISAGRSRPGAGTLRGNSSETQASVNMPRRHSSPIVSRGRSTEPVSKSRGFASANGHHADVHEPRKVSHAPEVVSRRSVKASTTTTDNTGFGRNISKKSLDMAIKHMDIRNGSGNNRTLSSTTLFPQSIRNSTPKIQSHRASSTPPTSIETNGNMLSKNNGSHFYVFFGINRNMMRGREVDERQYSAKLSEIDIYESSRYDALLLKEDLKNTNWLHSGDDKCDQGSLLFDNGFENLPEPFGLL
ncbi:hypothetical protein MTR_7g073720 [Medicago truncatula]|uniref:Uncharacterized protein n=1 Tax=Medicago truncatula TaxID=3880 RepID=A0A072UBT1_MEDTR|nr:hypothetical protein MTR_7g073720 [Medicago truncatula]